jgi:hypothetical protein
MDKVWSMQLLEYLNYAAMMLKEQKESSQRLDNAANVGKSSKSPDVFKIALLQEILHFKV